MNFADAIRKASRESESGFLALTPVYLAPADRSSERLVTLPEEQVAVQSFEVSKMEQRHPSQAVSLTSAGATVRMELTLTTEELSLLFRSIATSQHSILTCREAAIHLRLPAQNLEDMARTGEIPAFQIDGKWRFPKAGLDGWVAVRSAQQEAS